MLARVGINGAAISERLYYIALTMALTPFAVRLTPALYTSWRGRFPKEDMQTFNPPEAGLKDYVIVAGYGRIGSFVAGMLHRSGARSCSSTAPRSRRGGPNGVAADRLRRGGGADGEGGA